ncbi:PREDICTED: keratin, ultra high-sulfur matrix protein-like [Chlamydotis macqueenii]|uniref:keratin, ultra high-sulfur matrix protein-like n=1 Tax=Chlamydotis macqueenii TaxID=187382 RepID=UPI00052966FE|nr:PREDICTED: keratin, ultra high-sulfur matrix protein-like [Chlamydotis macqueenii]
MIYSSGRESFFNLNSTWYDPSGSWLDTRRTPFRYGYNTCSSGCDSEGVEGMRGHNYRHYGYRQSVCSERCHGYAAADSCHGGGGSSCVRRPTYSYGSSGGCQSYGRSVCSEPCHEPSGSCQGGGSSCVRRPTYSYGSSGGCQSYGRSVCSERCHGSSGSCQGGGGSSGVRRPTYSYGSSGGCQSYGRSGCAEPCHGSGYQGGKPCYSKPRQHVAQCCPVQTGPPPVQTCPPPVQTCPPPVQQGCVPMAKSIPRQQQKQVCKVPARKIK